MSKQRDAGTGRYLSEEQARTRPTNTWIKESGYKARWRKQLLEDLYNALLAKAEFVAYTNPDGTTNSVGPVVTLANIEQVLEDV